MSLETLVPDLDTCRRLKEAGYPQETALWWDRNMFHGKMHVTTHAVTGKGIAAPTFQEIWERLPIRIRVDGNWCGRTLFCDDDGDSNCGFDSQTKDVWEVMFSYRSAHVAAAELWLWCKENGHVSTPFGIGASSTSGFGITGTGHVVVENVLLRTTVPQGNRLYGGAVEVANAFKEYSEYVRFTKKPMSPAAYLNGLAALFRDKGEERDRILRGASHYLGAEFLRLFESNQQVFEAKMRSKETRMSGRLEDKDKELERYDALDAQDRMELEELRAERKYSPLPWSLRLPLWKQNVDGVPFFGTRLLDFDGEIVSGQSGMCSTDEALVVGNAEFIVEAVNAYDALIAYHRAANDLIVGGCDGGAEEVRRLYDAIPEITRQKLERSEA